MFVILFIVSLFTSSYSRILGQPKHCNTCRFFIENLKYKDSPDVGIYGKCSLFPVNNDKTDNIKYLVTGEKKISEKEYMYCSSARCYDDMCGEKGKLYKPKAKVTVVYNVNKIS